MIIKEIQAENVLKYSRLELTNLPAHGLIAISGPNESGKTTIAEIICLALFGRTYSLEPAEITKSIKWGEFYGSLRLEFSGKDGHHYTVKRDFDGDGNHTTRLGRSGEQMSIAQGVEAVAQAVLQLGGFSYERFIDSFYLAQRNTATPQALKSTVKILAGVEILEKISVELAQDIHNAHHTLSQLEPQIAEASGQLAELDIRDTTLSQLTHERQAQLERIAEDEAEITRLQSTSGTPLSATSRLTERVNQVVGTGVNTSLAKWQEHAQHLEGALEAVNEACRSLHTSTGPEVTRELRVWLDDFRSRLHEFDKVRELSALYRERLARVLGLSEKGAADSAGFTPPLPAQHSELNNQLDIFGQRRTRALLGFGIALVGTLASWGAWWLLRFAGDTQLAKWLVTNLGMGNPSGMLMVLAAGVGFGVVCLAFLVRSLAVASRMIDTRQELVRLSLQAERAGNEAQTIDNLIDLPLPNELDALRSLPDEQLSAALSAFASGPAAPLLEAQALSAYMAKLSAALGACEDGVQTLRGRLDRQISEVRAKLDGYRQQVRRLDQEIAEGQARREKAEQLNRQIRALQDTMEGHKQQIATCRIAEKLLNGTYNRLYARFNLETRHVVGKIMARLTEERYQSLQVDQDLQIQVLSNEKGNFVGLNEISGGTYHQLLLSIRLALSQASISSSIGGAQFIILDEPFAFFDENRTRKTLEALPRISEEMTQVWVCSPQFGSDMGFDLHLRCARDSDTLIASGS